MSRIVVNSAAAISGSCMGTIPKPNNRSGTAAHRAAVDSLTYRAMANPSAAGRS
jgi:hypothetical protein